MVRKGARKREGSWGEEDKKVRKRPSVPPGALTTKGEKKVRLLKSPITGLTGGTEDSGGVKGKKSAEEQTTYRLLASKAG